MVATRQFVFGIEVPRTNPALSILGKRSAKAYMRATREKPSEIIK